MTITVNGTEIPDTDVFAEMQHHPAANRDAALASAAEALIVRELLRQRSAQLGLFDYSDNDPEHEEAAMAALVEREVRTPVADEIALRRFYDANREKFRTAALFEASHILLAAQNGGRDARDWMLALAKKIIAQLMADPQAFEALASQYSACSSGASGGQLGQLGEGEIVPELETFLRELDEGQICPVPVESPSGFHVLRLDRRSPSQPSDFETARPRVREILERLSRQRAIAQYISLLAGESEIEGYAFRGAASALVQ